MRRRKSKWQWKPGNRVELLVNGDNYFPRLIEAIQKAEREIILETYIFHDDSIGTMLQQELIAAAKRGVWVSVTVDGYGSHNLSKPFISAMTDAQIVFQVFDPQPLWKGLRANIFRRLHRKLVVIDGSRAFVGGINVCDDQFLDAGREAKLDYAVELHGPVVTLIRQFCLSFILDDARHRGQTVYQPPDLGSAVGEGDVEVMFVARDNKLYRTDIERQYLLALRRAKSTVTIANAYFFPGFRMLRELSKAARRGVDVRLILQGEPDVPVAKSAGRTLYHHLTRSGVKIYEYCERPLHGKVAVIDDWWSTVGSSNLDPLSLSLNLEANVLIRDRGFGRQLREHLERLLEQSRPIDRNWVRRRRFWRLTIGVLVYHALRLCPAIISWLPAHTQRLRPAKGQGETP